MKQATLRQFPISLVRSRSPRAERIGGRKRNRLRGYLGIFAGALLLSTGSGGSLRAQEVGAENARTTVASLQGLQEAFASIAEEVEPTVVTVSSFKTIRSAADTGEFPNRSFDGGPRRAVGTGTGVIIRKDGWILTNDHVVNGADRVTVKLHDGRELSGTVISDPHSDLAVIKIESKTPLPVARLGDSDRVKIGHWAIAIGSPYRFEGSFSVGVISSLYRRQRITEAGEDRLYPNMMQTDAAINPGNSGGPLCNIAGEVIAINTAIESERGGSIGIGFAIPINTAKFVANQLIDTGKVVYGYLGVSPTSVTPKQALALKIDHGALIDEEPQDQTPAAKAGLHVGDVITSIDSKPIHNELDLRTIIAQTPPDTVVKLTVVRDGEPSKINATIGKLEVEAGIHKPAADKPHLGIAVKTLTDTLADRAGVPRTTQGVYVTTIDPSSSAADEEDFGERCVILSLNGKGTPDENAFQQAVAPLKSGEQVRVVYLKQIRGEGSVKRFAVLTVD